ncbi:serine protease, partial [Kibdelosporangium lantanae]
EHLHGYSGSALLSGNTVVGIHNTGNDSGEQCTDDNPCEVAADGTVTSTRGRGYGQQVDQIAACFTGSRLDRTYAQLTAKVHDLTTRPMKAGDRVDMLAGSARGACTVEAVVPHLREGGYQEDNSVRYATSDACEHLHGYSGSALLSGNTVVGIHNTGNDSGEQCTDDNPCEVAA